MSAPDNKLNEISLPLTFQRKTLLLDTNSKEYIDSLCEILLASMCLLNNNFQFTCSVLMISCLSPVIIPKLKFVFVLLS